jgi:hypothetical protein
MRIVTVVPSSSKCAADVYGNEAEWRERYWITFLKCQTTKLPWLQHSKDVKLALPIWIQYPELYGNLAPTTSGAGKNLQRCC